VIAVDYDDSGTVRNVLESEGVAFEGTYVERVAFRVTLPEATVPALKDRIADATSGRAAWERVGDSRG
jgi:putative IMPACT (imprinted ancient) family translation regulator